MLADLLTEPGASRTVIDAFIPYSHESLARYIGRVPEHYCSPQTARMMATTAFHHARRIIRSHILRNSGELSDESSIRPGSTDVSHDVKTRFIRPKDIDSEERLTPDIAGVRSDADELDPFLDTIGIGCSASLSTNREKKGELKVFVVLQSLRRTIQFSLNLHKGARTRQEEERLVGDLVLNAIESIRRATNGVPPAISKPKHYTNEPFCGLFSSGSTDNFPLTEVIPLQLNPGETVTGKQRVGSLPLVELFYGKLWAVLWQNEMIQNFISRQRDDMPSGTGFNPHAEYMQAIFPGSFNPIHKGHLKMVAVAEQRLQNKVVLELSIRNADKPPLDYIGLDERLQKISATNPKLAVWLTQTPLFEEKADLFREATFIVGTDTLRRFADLKFYHESTHQLQDVLRRVAYYNCRFIVFPRQSDQGIETMDGMDIPDMLRSLCDEVPISEFAENISSTELRKL